LHRDRAAEHAAEQRDRQPERRRHDEAYRAFERRNDERDAAERRPDEDQACGGTAADIAAVKEAFGLARRGNSSRATEVQATITDPVARKLVPLILKVALSSVAAGKLKVNVAPASGSVPLNTPTTALAPAFSAIVLFAKLMFVGVSFTSVTARANCLSKGL
jgi:hypothetical protein